MPNLMLFKYDVNCRIIAIGISYFVDHGIRLLQTQFGNNEKAKLEESSPEDDTNCIKSLDMKLWTSSTNIPMNLSKVENYYLMEACSCFAA